MRKPAGRVATPALDEEDENKSFFVEDWLLTLYERSDVAPRKRLAVRLAERRELLNYRSRQARLAGEVSVRAKRSQAHP